MQLDQWNIIVSGSTEVYVTHENEFVARFKYANPKRSANHFVKFLEKNFTPAEYFAERAKGVSPLPILEAKGYVCYNVEQNQKKGITNMCDISAAIKNFSQQTRG